MVTAEPNLRVQPATHWLKQGAGRTALPMEGRKPVAELGGLQHLRGSQWRAKVWLQGVLVCGPARLDKAAAEADLRLAQAAADRSDMAAVLQRLKDDAEVARRNAVEEFHRMMEARAAKKCAAKLQRLECDSAEAIQAAKRQRAANAEARLGLALYPAPRAQPLSVPRAGEITMYKDGT